MMVGGFLSTCFLKLGLRSEQFPIVPQTERLSVAALAVSVPSGMLVVRRNDASAEFATRLPLSLAVHRIDTSEPCHAPSGVSHLMSGGILSVTGINLNPRAAPDWCTGLGRRSPQRY